MSLNTLTVRCLAFNGGVRERRWKCRADISQTVKWRIGNWRT